jgi:ABC-type lipoprotein export system ATPase subunit
MPKALVELDRVSRSFRVNGDEIAALTNASCAISAADRIAIMGPSGSGKSTLLALMSQLDMPTSGSISWPGFPAGEALRPRHIGLAFQTPSLIPALTALENVEVPLLILDESENVRARAMAALDSLDLGSLADRLPEELSGGQAQRVATARALVTHPGLLLADEPTGQLDQATGQALIRQLIEVSEKAGSALVIATHDPAIARQMKTVWRMDFGRLETVAKLRAAS